MWDIGVLSNSFVFKLCYCVGICCVDLPVWLYRWSAPYSPYLHLPGIHHLTDCSLESCIKLSISDVLPPVTMTTGTEGFQVMEVVVRASNLQYESCGSVPFLVMTQNATTGWMGICELILGLLKLLGWLKMMDE